MGDKLLCCVAAALLFACGGNGDDDDDDIIGCEDEVWIQAFSNYPDPVTMEVTTAAHVCPDDHTLSPIPQDAMPVHLESDPEAGQTVTYKIILGPPAVLDKQVTCTIAPKGIELTYVRAGLDFLGELTCDCGYDEYYVDNPIDSCI